MVKGTTLANQTKNYLTVKSIFKEELKLDQLKTTRPRPMHTKSPVFEEGYARFLADVFKHGIKSVECEETELIKTIVLAKCRRLVFVKATGLLHMEQLKGSYENDAAGEWVLDALPDFGFWVGEVSLKDFIASAWNLRINDFVPAPKVCFPKNKKANDLRNSFIAMAAQRRLSGKFGTLATKTFVQRLWKFLVDGESLRLCIAYFGHGAKLQDYNFTVRRRGDLIARELETPHLTPLIGAYIRSSNKLKSGLYKIPNDVLLYTRDWFFGAQLSPSGWRYIAAGTRAFIEAVVRRRFSYYEGGISNGAAFNLLAETGERYPHTFLLWILDTTRQIWGNALETRRESFVRFIRLAGREAIIAKKKKRLRRFVQGELLLAWDWLKRTTHDHYDQGDIRDVPKNATWASIMRAQEAWHREYEERERLQLEADEKAYKRFVEEQAAMQWESIVGPEIINDVTVLPLTSGQALMDESISMEHCVRDYILVCAKGVSRIFHLSKKSEEATLEIHKTDGNRWKVRQVFGKENDPSSIEMWKTAKAIASRYSKASKLLDNKLTIITPD